jgi:hypothetical protein
VTTSAHGHLELVRPGEVERGRDIRRARATSDQRGPAVDEGVEAAARRVVPGLARAEHGAGQRTPQLDEA